MNKLLQELYEDISKIGVIDEEVIWKYNNEIITAEIINYLYRECLNPLLTKIGEHKYYVFRLVLDKFNGIVESLLLAEKKPIDHYSQTRGMLIDAMDMNVRFAVVLDYIGIPGLSWEYLAKGYDLLHKKYNYHTNEGNVFLDDRVFENEATRRIYISENIPGHREDIVKRNALFIKLKTVIGDVDRQGIDFYESTSSLVIIGEDSKDEDITWLCCWAEFLDLYYKNSPQFIEIFEKLKSQLKIEEKKLLSNSGFNICYTLFSITHNPEYYLKSLNFLCLEPLKSIKFYYSFMLYLAHRTKSIENIKKFFPMYLNVINNLHQDSLQNRLYKQANSDIIIQTVLTCITFREYDLAIEFAYLWRTDRELEPLLPSEVILFTINNLHNNKVYHLIKDCKKLKVLELESKTPKSTVTKIQQKIDGIFGVNMNDPDSLYFDESMLGTDENASDFYEQAIIDHFNLDTLVKELENYPNDSEIRTFELSWSNTAHNPILSSMTGLDICSLATHQSGITLRKIKKVLIWCDPDQTLNFAVKEKEFIIKLFDKENISYDLFEGNTCTKDCFIETYSNDNYDLVWIMCHGNFDSSDPTESSLTVECNNKITIRELINLAPNTPKIKRLLVLNACQSSSAHVRYNSMNLIGIATSLTTPSQSVLGHLWLVDFMASTIFGWLFIKGLIENLPWSKSVSTAISVMRKGNCAIIEEMKTLDEDFDLIKEYTTKDMNKIFYSGSPILYT